MKYGALIWQIFLDYKTSKIEGFRYISVKIDNFSEIFLCIPSKNRYSKTVTDVFSKILSTSKRSHIN